MTRAMASAIIATALVLSACDAFVFLHGHVVGPDGKPIATARIHVMPEHNNPEQVDAEGSFEARSSGGSIEVLVTADGYRPVEKAVKGGMLVYSCTFILGPISGPTESQADCHRR